MDNQDAPVDRWLEEIREHSYRLEVGGVGKLASIFMVPDTLKANDAIFTPQVISIGPYHFLEPHLSQMEQEKSKVIARAVMNKHHLHLQDDGFFGTVVPRCRDFYGDAQVLRNLNEEAFAMMLFRDTSFLLLFLEHHVVNQKRITRSQPSASDNSDPFHDLKSGTGLRLAVKSDIIILENQIPLSTLQSLYALVDNPHQSYSQFLVKVCSEYSPFMNKPREIPDLASKRHLLHCVHATVYMEPPDQGVLPKPTADRGPPSGEGPGNWWSPLTWLKDNCRWVRGSNRHSTGYKPLEDDRLRNYAKNSLRSASQLSKAGVKFRPCLEGRIEHIRFDSDRSTLYLPQVKIGPMTETIIRNLIAFELGSPEIKQNAVVGYSRLLKELTQDARDAELLRRSEILANLGVGDEKMVEIVKGLSSSTWKPYCKPVNKARNDLIDYYSRSTLKILCSEFRDTYCSKPWVLISALAATALLFMTAVQVFCLFYTCNKNS